MKTKKTFEEYKEIFEIYAAEYFALEEEESVPYKYMVLKFKHTYKVIDIIERVAKSLDLNDDDVELAKIIALFHDIGRFKQIHKYKSDIDSKTENHALLGVNEIKEKKILEDEDEETRLLILKAIMYHNIKDIPEDEKDELVILFSKLIRDSDKIDIYRVMTEDINEGMSDEEKEKLYDGLEISYKTSDYVYQTIMSGKTIDRRNVKTYVDKILMQICWASNDMNFEESRKIIKEQGFLTKLFESTETDMKAKEVYNMVMKKLGGE